ncbi:unnamed protein product [Arabis nemorensis]|uniref:Transmembrane protein n=1 Tax=Arabis nemorensis TaxID=586526 RepID=A0A565ALD7_9BRAS|nr:unnamed protein product [Arabis nemorensis]
MASHSYSKLGFSLLQELGSNEIIKQNRAYYLVNNPGGRRHETKPQSSFKLKLEHLEPWKPFCSWRSKSNHFVEFDSTMMKPRHVHETGHEEVKTRVKPSPKKQNPKIRDRDNDLHRRNHLYACESLTSLMLGSEQHRQITLQSLKKSCGDLSELLTRLSIGFAGTGIAVFFSVVCSVASRRVFFCADEVFDGALSLSLVLLSWSVVRLRETIVDVNRKAIKEEEITNRVERRIKDVYFRAATVIIMVALRFGRT